MGVNFSVLNLGVGYDSALGFNGTVGIGPEGSKGGFGLSLTVYEGGNGYSTGVNWGSSRSAGGWSNSFGLNYSEIAGRGPTIGATTGLSHASGQNFRDSIGGTFGIDYNLEHKTLGGSVGMTFRDGTGSPDNWLCSEGCSGGGGISWSPEAGYSFNSSISDRALTQRFMDSTGITTAGGT